MKIKVIYVLSFLICLCNTNFAQKSVPNTTSPKKFSPKEFNEESPKSIIFIIADGTGLSQYSLSYYTNSNFSINRFKHIGLVTTHPNDKKKKVTDSAASGTALATGEKTYNGAISVDNNHQPIKTVLEWAIEEEMSTGLVATSTITHATPASFAAHVKSRVLQNDIAHQMASSNVNVLLGGGKKYWTENSIGKFIANNGVFIDNIEDTVPNNKNVLGLFNEDGLPPANKRVATTTKMAKKALNILEKNKNGFFLMVEESQVDWSGHSNDGVGSSSEMESLNELVNFCIDYQENNPSTLVLLTSDHECGGLAINDGENNEMNCSFTTTYHTATLVPVFAIGPGSKYFNQFLDNTDIGKKLIEYVKNNSLN
tara:strand:- start:225 stop:1331 length:1107 start_codon:yes stop_codon:yes gene_type:complete